MSELNVVVMIAEVSTPYEPSISCGMFVPATSHSCSIGSKSCWLGTGGTLCDTSWTSQMALARHGPTLGAIHTHTKLTSGCV
jgi:hypothetical protein